MGNESWRTYISKFHFIEYGKNAFVCNDYLSPPFSQAIGFTLFKSSSVSKTMKRGLQE